MKPKILFYSEREVNAIMGGVERVTESLARHLIKDGYNVVFMSEQHTCDGKYKPLTTQYFTRERENQQWILEIIQRHSINLVISQTKSFNEICPKSVLPADVRVVTVIHDSYYAMYPRLQLNFLRKWNWRRVITRSMRNAYNNSDRVVLFLPPYIDEYRFFCPEVCDDKFAVIPNFNSFDDPVIAPKEKKLLWVGRHNEWHKRTTDMLRIWNRLERSFPDWSLDILGDGPDADNVRKLHNSLGLRRCTLRGTQDPTPYYQRAAIICMTSAFESFGMVLTEGMQHGCVPVAYDAYTAVRHIIHDNDDGAMVTPFDTEAYADTLASLMSDDTERTRRANAAIQSVKQFDAERIIPLWLKLIDNI